MLKRLKNTRFSILQKLRNKIAPGKNVFKTLISPQDIYESTETHSNLHMDDVAQEYIAQITESTYEQQNQTNTDFATSPNFGTVDNPMMIFTTDYPFRFVSCTGHPNEDDYEGHEPMWFILREGSLQRCAQCGQVFKLIKLRQDEEDRNSYYNNLIGKPGLLQLEDQDHPGVTSLRTFFQLQETPTMISKPQSNFYSLINPDDHDKFLVDPSYRMERNMDAERVIYQTMENFQELTKQYEEQYGVRQMPMSRQIYENLVEAELAVKNLDKHFSNVLKFNYRKILDPENHERREKRMLERQEQRQDRIRDFGLVVDEAKEGYKDYYETDLENETSQNIFDNFNEQKQEIMSDSSMKIKNLEFQELYNDEKHPDCEGVLNRKIFRFKYREAFYTLEDHERKEERMVSRNQDLSHLQDLQQLAIQQNQFDFKKLLSHQSQDIKNIEESNKQNVELEYYNSLIKQSLKCYKDYFESDLEDDFEIIEDMPFETQIKTTEMLSNTHINYVLRLQPEQVQMGEDYGMSQLNDVIQETFGQNIFGSHDNKIDEINFQELFQKYKPLGVSSINDSVNRIEQIMTNDLSNRWDDQKQKIQELKQSIEDISNKQHNGEHVESLIEKLQHNYQDMKKKIHNVTQKISIAQNDQSVKDMLRETREKVEEKLSEQKEKVKEVKEKVEEKLNINQPKESKKNSSKNKKK